MSRVDALLREREGYVNRGLANRVAQVDAELARFGVAVGPDVEVAAKPSPTPVGEHGPEEVVATVETAVKRGRPRKAD